MASKRKNGAESVVDILVKLPHGELAKVAPKLVKKESEVASFLAGKLGQALSDSDASAGKPGESLSSPDDSPLSG